MSVRKHCGIIVIGFIGNNQIQDGMGVENVPVSGAPSPANTLEVSYHSFIRILLSALPWTEKDIQALEDVQRTFTHRITEVQHLNCWGKIAVNSYCSPYRDDVNDMELYIFGR